MSTVNQARRVGDWLGDLAKLYLGKKSACVLVAWLLLSVSAHAQETMIALPAAEVKFLYSRTGFPINVNADCSAWMKNYGQFDPADGWVISVWAVVNTAWREANLTHNNFRFIHATDGTMAVSSQSVDLGAQAVYRNVLIGNEARAAVFVRNLSGIVSDGSHSYQFWAKNSDSTPYAKCVDFFIVQIRLVRSETGEGTGTTVELPLAKLSNPDDYAWESYEQEYEDVESSVSRAEEEKNETYMWLETWPEFVPIHPQDSAAPPYWMLHIPVIDRSVSLNINPLVTSYTVGGGTAGVLANTVVMFRTMFRQFLLLILYGCACRRVLTLLTVG